MEIELENENLRVFSSKEVKKLTKKFGHNRLVVDNNGFGRLFYQGYVNETTFSPSKNGTGLAVSVMHCVLHSSEELEEWKVTKICPYLCNFIYTYTYVSGGHKNY